MTPEMKVLFDMAIAHIGALIMSKHLSKDDRLLLLVLAECVKERMTGKRGSLSPIVDAVETALAKIKDNGKDKSPGLHLTFKEKQNYKWN